MMSHHDVVYLKLEPTPHSSEVGFNEEVASKHDNSSWDLYLVDGQSQSLSCFLPFFAIRTKRINYAEKHKRKTFFHPRPMKTHCTRREKKGK